MPIKYVWQPKIKRIEDDIEREKRALELVRQEQLPWAIRRWRQPGWYARTDEEGMETIERELPWLPAEMEEDPLYKRFQFEKEAKEWLPWIGASVAFPQATALRGWQLAGKLPAWLEYPAKTILSPLAGVEKGLSAFGELGKRAVGKLVETSPIKALVEKHLQLPEKTMTHTYEQLLQGHKLARAKNLLNKKTGQPTKSYRNFAQIYTSKTSMKDMTRGEADRFITALSELEVVGVKPPKIPKITTLMSKEFWDKIPVLKDIGFVDYFRQKQQVLRMLGIDDLADDLLKTDVLLTEEKQLFLKELAALKGMLGNVKERAVRVFDALESPVKTHLLDPDEQKVFLFARKFFDQWADALKIPLEKRKVNYITHIFDAQLIADAKAKRTLPLEILKALEFNFPRKTYMPFLKQRFGAEIGLKKDPFAAMQVYESYALRQKYYQPLLQKLSSYISMFEARGKMTTANYLKDMARRIGGRPAKEDLLISESINSFAKALSKVPGIKDIGGVRLETLASRGNVGAVIAHNFASLYYLSWLGFRPVSAIRNLSQQLLAVAEVGPLAFARGLTLGGTAGGKTVLAKSLLRRSRIAGQPVPGLEEEALMRLPPGLLDKGLKMFKGADKLNVGNSFLGGYVKGRDLGLPESWAIRYGDEVAGNTQYIYTKLARSLFEDTTLGRFATPFTSWPRNFLELFSKWIQGRPSIVLQQYAKETGKQITIPKRDLKPLLTYMAILTGAYITEGTTAIKATQYTGWTSIRNLGQMLGGDIPAMQIPRSIAYLVAGAASGDVTMMKKGWAEIRPDRFVQIIKQIEDIAEGKADILSLFLYLDRQEMQEAEDGKRRFKRTPSRERGQFERTKPEFKRR